MIERIATVKKTSEILQKYSINPKPRYGQNFMVNPKIPSFISECELITKETLVIEIGPGLGALTQFLLEKSKKVICYEIDNTLANILKDSLKDYSNLEIINNDFLKEDLSNINYNNYSNIVVVSNLPYYITSDILIKLLKSDIRFDILAMMQKEVAIRIKNSNKKDINELVLYSHLYSDVIKYVEVSKNDFFPRPNVDSTVLLFKKKEVENKEIYEFIINELFKQKRKTIVHNLKNIVYGYQTNQILINKIIKEAKINEKTRIDELELKDLIFLIEIIKNNIFLNCCGKLNLGLKVYPKENGMHNLSSIFVPINLYNNVKIGLLDQNEYILKGDAINNQLIEKLINSLKNRYIFEFGLYINIEKNIPENSGLGGGSSVVGSIINYIGSIFNLSEDIKKEIALEVGSDCCYFLDPKIKYLNNSISNYENIKFNFNFNILLIKPNCGNLTKEVYDEFDEINKYSNSFDLVKYIDNYDLFIKNIYNDLSDSAIKKNHEILDTISYFKKYKFDYIGITGSGSCLYCISLDKEKILKAYDNAKSQKLFTKIVSILK